MSSNRVAKAADQNQSQQQTIPAAIATVVDANPAGEPVVVEIDGTLYRHCNDQDEARAELAQRRRWDQICAFGVSQDLISEYEFHAVGLILEEQDGCMRRIGHLLSYHGQHDLWRLVYLEYNQGEGYALGDETLFLLSQPRSTQAGYAGPPSIPRFNSAVEAAAQRARRTNGVKG